MVWRTVPGLGSEDSWFLALHSQRILWGLNLGGTLTLTPDDGQASLRILPAESSWHILVLNYNLNCFLTDRTALPAITRALARIAVEGEVSSSLGHLE